MRATGVPSSKCAGRAIGKSLLRFRSCPHSAELQGRFAQFQRHPTVVKTRSNGHLLGGVERWERVLENVERQIVFATRQAAEKLRQRRAALRVPIALQPVLVAIELADKILTSRSALEGERKQVTVMFADVKGSMDLVAQVDAETWHGIMDRFFAILADGVHRFEGTINQYTGDGIMALFGAPIAHEDHARRACYAALHLSDGLRTYANELRLRRGLNFSARIGINSG